jgi:hypothetical protein
LLSQRRFGEGRRLSEASKWLDVVEEWGGNILPYAQRSHLTSMIQRIYAHNARIPASHGCNILQRRFRYWGEVIRRYVQQIGLDLELWKPSVRPRCPMGRERCLILVPLEHTTNRTALNLILSYLLDLSKYNHLQGVQDCR